MKQKGVAIRSTLAALEKLHGADAVATVKRVMPARLSAQLEAVLPLEWYSIELSAALHVAVRDTVGKGGWAESHAIGIEAARIDFTGVYRAILRTVQYESIWKRIERAWLQYNSGGDARWVEQRSGYARAEIKGVGGFNVGVWNAVAGRCEGLLLMAGARGANVSVVTSTSTSASLEALWLE